jgi:hypothetical protein
VKSLFVAEDDKWPGTPFTVGCQTGLIWHIYLVFSCLATGLGGKAEGSDSFTRSSGGTAR